MQKLGVIQGSSRGQTTIEYILMMAVAVVLFMILRKILGPYLSGYAGNFYQFLDQTVFDARKMHKLSF